MQGINQLQKISKILLISQNIKSLGQVKIYFWGGGNLKDTKFGEFKIGGGRNLELSKLGAFEI